MTQLRTIQNNLIIISNKHLLGRSLLNYSLPETWFSVAIGLSVKSGTEPHRIEHILLDEISLSSKYIPGLLMEPAPYIRFLPGFAADALRLKLVIHVNDIRDQNFVEHELGKRILMRIKREGIDFTLPVSAIEMNRGE